MVDLQVVGRPEPAGPRVALVGLAGSVLDDVRAAAPPGWVEVARDPSVPGAAARLAGASPDAVLLFDGHAPERSLAELGEMVRLLPGARIFLLSPVKDPDRILRAMREGAAEYIVLPEDLGELARSLAQSGRARPGSAASGRLVALVGARGGVGTTTCAVQLAGELNALRPGRVALVDVNPVAPDAGVFLDLDLPFGLLDVMRNVHRLDETLLHGVLTRHPSGLAVVALPEDDAGRAEVARLGAGAALRALEVLRTSMDAVVLDCGSVPDAFTAPLLAGADPVLLVVHADVASVKNALRRQAWLRAAGVPDAVVSLAINRHGNRPAHIRESELMLSLACPTAATLPPDPAAAAALETGRLLASDRGLTPLRQELRRLAESWFPPAPGGRGRFAFFRRHRAGRTPR
ncbi:hypothetical protein L6R50_12145 [Myxococcota bacterium]|nr:hypothetical protein [Myxococcota bacterium]